jgi:hypothetical protein
VGLFFGEKMKTLLHIALLTLFASCGMMKTAKVHTQMGQEISRDGMNISKDELLKKLTKSFDKSDFSFDGKMVVMNSMPPVSFEREEQIRNRMEDGFTYKNKFYSTTPEFGLDIFMSNTEQLKDKMFKAKFHVIENTKDQFIVVNKDQIYVGKRLTKSKTRLEIFKLKDVVQPLKLNVNWFALVNQGALFNISNAPVDLEASMKYKYRIPVAELQTYFELLPSIANSREQEILSSLKE